MGDAADDVYDAAMREGWDEGEWCHACKKQVPECKCYACPSCHGTGYVNPLSSVRSKEFFCTGTTECPDCDGSGEI